MAEDGLEVLMATEQRLARRLAEAQIEAQEIVQRAQRHMLDVRAEARLQRESALAEVSAQMLASRNAELASVQAAAAAETARLEHIPDEQLRALATLVLSRLSAGDADRDPT